MKDEQCFNKMLSKLEGTFDFLFKSATVMLVVVILSRLAFLPDDRFVVVDIILLIFMIGIQVFSKNVSHQVRLNHICITLVIVGFLSYLEYGLIGSGFGILFLANAIVAIFGNSRFFRLIAGSTFVGVIGITLLRELTLNLHNASISRYFFQFMLMFACIFLVRVAISGLRFSFVNNIRELDYNLQENELMFSELKEQHEELKNSKVEIYQLAYYDCLTSLPKKNNFKNYVNHRMPHVEKATMMKADLKDFKLINSVYGNQVGDQLIKLIGDIVTEINDPLLYACRFSGDDFVFWYESNDFLLMKQLLDKLILEFNVRTRQFFTYSTINFNMAFISYPDDGTSYNDLLNKLSIAVNFAKTSESTHIMKFVPEMEEQIQNENHMKELIEDAISRRSFEIYYQEKYDIISNQVIGLEALSRWHSDDLGDVTPDEFIPLIHKYQLVSSFERLVIGKVFTDYPELIKKYGHIPIGINISPEHLTTRQFVKYFSDAIMLYKVDPDDIILEITEDIVRKDLDHVHNTLVALRSMGLKIAIDIFGSGYSSLNFLVRLPFDELKVDRSFIADIENIRVQNILKAIIKMEDFNDVRIIAEGVENVEQLDILKSLGYKYIQGFLYAVPKPLTKLIAENFTDSSIG